MTQARGAGLLRLTRRAGLTAAQALRSREGGVVRMRERRLVGVDMAAGRAAARALGWEAGAGPPGVEALRGRAGDGAVRGGGVAEAGRGRRRGREWVGALWGRDLGGAEGDEGWGRCGGEAVRGRGRGPCGVGATRGRGREWWGPKGAGPEGRGAVRGRGWALLPEVLEGLVAGMWERGGRGGRGSGGGCGTWFRGEVDVLAFSALKADVAASR